MSEGEVQSPGDFARVSLPDAAHLERCIDVEHLLLPFDLS